MAAQEFKGGSCLWYTNAAMDHPTWSCLAGLVNGNKPNDKEGALVGSVKWNVTYTDGQVVRLLAHIHCVTKRVPHHNYSKQQNPQTNCFGDFDGGEGFNKLV